MINSKITIAIFSHLSVTIKLFVLLPLNYILKSTTWIFKHSDNFYYISVWSKCYLLKRSKLINTYFQNQNILQQKYSMENTKWFDTKIDISCAVKLSAIFKIQAMG